MFRLGLLSFLYFCILAYSYFPGVPSERIGPQPFKQPKNRFIKGDSHFASDCHLNYNFGKEILEMAEERQIPDWVKALSEAMAHTIEFPATTTVGWYYEQPDENEWGIHTIFLYPEPVEIQEAGPKDGELVFPQANSVDILEAQKQLDDVISVIVEFDPEGQSTISFEGTYQGQAVMVLLYLEPFSDDQEDEIE
jgi:hypothetical protein